MMPQQAPVNYRRISQNFFSGWCHVTAVVPTISNGTGAFAKFYSVFFETRATNSSNLESKG